MTELNRGLSMGSTDFNSVSSIVSSERSSSNSPTMALVIDVQSLDRMDREDAQNYVDKLGKSLQSLRDKNIPVTWVTMREGSQLYLPTSTGNDSEVRDLSQLREMGFYGIDSEYPNHDILEEFLTKYGPRTNEVVSCKSFKSALIEQDDVKGRPDYQKTLEVESGGDFSNQFTSQPTLAESMRSMVVQSTILMGAVSSHCISETAISSSLKGFNPQVAYDLVLSWQGDENKVVPRTSTLLWRGTSPDNNNEWNKFHLDKIQNRLVEISYNPVRDFSQSDRSSINRIGLSVIDDIVNPSSISSSPDLNRTGPVEPSYR